MSLRVVQISDSHIAHDSSQRVKDLEKCVQHINTIEPKPDLVVHTGDITHNAQQQEYTTARRCLDSLGIPYCVLAGNKDKRVELLETFGSAVYFQPNFPWIQYAIEHLPVRLLMLDTLHNNSNKGEFCKQRLTHLEQMLNADLSRPVAVFMHHPPFEATGIPDPYQFEDWTEAEAIRSLLGDSDNIVGVYCGHVHRNITSSVHQIPASAITCMAGDLRKGEVTAAEREVPALRILEF